jgi:CMP-N,N'-diacetyllegionaminic acid synthase
MRSPGKTLAIIPARGGSKRLPKKNIKLLNGIPLINYSIQAAKQSKYIDEVIVSSDSEDIIEIAVKCGARVPFTRPPELAQDDTLTEEVLRHAVNFYDQEQIRFETIVLIQATSPFTTVKMIDECIETLVSFNWGAVITVKPLHFDERWVGIASANNGYIRPFKDVKLPAGNNMHYYPSGNVYAITRDVCFNQNRIIGDNTGMVVIHEQNALDIDYLSDFKYAEYLLKSGEIKIEH